MIVKQTSKISALIAGIVWSLGTASCVAAVPGPERPSIVFILADDVGRDWISCCGPRSRRRTLTDWLVQGIRFQTVWATPLCTPTRVEFLTGQYPFRNGWKVHHDVPARGGNGLDSTRRHGFEPEAVCQIH